MTAFGSVSARTEARCATSSAGHSIREGWTGGPATVEGHKHLAISLDFAWGQWGPMHALKQERARMEMELRED